MLLLGFEGYVSSKIILLSDPRTMSALVKGVGSPVWSQWR